MVWTTHYYCHQGNRSGLSCQSLRFVTYVTSSVLPLFDVLLCNWRETLQSHVPHF